MTAYVFFMIFCSLIGVAVGGIAVFGILHSAGNQKQKAGKSQKRNK